MSGVVSYRSLLMTVLLQDPCVIETEEAHGYSTGDFVRITNIGYCRVGGNATDFGAWQLNNNLYKIIVTGDQTFQLKDHITDKFINSTNFAPYVSHGQVNKVRHDFVYLGDE